MTDSKFDALLDERLDRIRETLGRKAKEYATSKDRLHNFKESALLLRTTPIQALLGMLAKHLVSIVDLSLQASAGPQFPSMTAVEEKIGDAINYLILLEALFQEACPLQNARNHQCLASREAADGHQDLCQLPVDHQGDHQFSQPGRCPSIIRGLRCALPAGHSEKHRTTVANGRCQHLDSSHGECRLPADHSGPHLTGIINTQELSGRCPWIIKGEQCALEAGHDGGCKWSNGD